MSLLYAYAKYVVLSQADKASDSPLLGPNTTTTSILVNSSIQKNFIGSAIGALEECLRSQVKERHPKISYLLGRAFLELKRPLKVNEHWGTLLKNAGLEAL